MYSHGYVYCLPICSKEYAKAKSMRPYTCPRLYIKDMEMDFLATF